jgi:hypothetical protein
MEIARYDQASDPAWTDNVADPTDWRPADLPLDDFIGQQILVRFRVQTDPLAELDGWYLDNVRVNEGDCTLAAVGPAAGTAGLTGLMAPYPNPMTGTARFAFQLATPVTNVSMSVHDISGRLVRRESLGHLETGTHTWLWDGRGDSGSETTNGVYFARLEVAGKSFTQKILKVAR